MAHNPQVGLIVFPLKSPDYECGQLLLGQFIQIIASSSERVSVITGNYFPHGTLDNVEIKNVNAPKVKFGRESLISKLYRLALAQFTLSLKLLRFDSGVNVVSLFLGSGLLFLPALVARIQRRKIVAVSTGSFSQSTRAMYKPPLGWLFYLVMRLIEQLSYRLASRITVGSESMIKDLGLNRYQRKVLSGKVTGYIDVDIFKIKRTLPKRGNIIGYIGRLSAEKGVLEFAKAIPQVVSQIDGVKFLIVGNGPLKEEIKHNLERAGCIDKVSFEDWVPHENVPSYLNKMKIHVLPSHTEALGGTNLEAMACGTISIVNSVGGLSDVVIDGETGFLLKNNSPQTIADKVIEVLDSPDLRRIQRNARAFVEANFSYDQVKEQWKCVFSNLSLKKGVGHEYTPI